MVLLLSLIASSHFFSFFKISFCVLKKHTLLIPKGDCSNPKFSFISDFIVWMVSSIPSHSGWRGTAFTLQLALEQLMSQHVNSPLLLCSQLASLGNGQASSTSWWATLTPTDLTTQLPLTRFCLETILGRERHYECIRVAKCSFWDICRKYFLNIISLKLYF